MITAESILGIVGADTALGRMIAYSDMRYDFVPAIDQLVGTDRIERAGDSPADWAELCKEARVRIEAVVAHSRETVAGINDRHVYMTAVLNAHWTAMRRLVHPTMSVVEVDCRGVTRRVRLGKRTTHGERCSCQLLDETVGALEAATSGLSTWARFEAEPLMWLGMRGLLAPHVVRLRHGVPTHLEDSIGTDPVSGYRFRVEWGYRGPRPARLAQALLADTLGMAPAQIDSKIADRFVIEVVSTFQNGQGFLLAQGQIDEWLDRHGLGPSRACLCQICADKTPNQAN